MPVLDVSLTSVRSCQIQEPSSSEAAVALYSHVLIVEGLSMSSHQAYTHMYNTYTETQLATQISRAREKLSLFLADRNEGLLSGITHLYTMQISLTAGPVHLGYPVDSHGSCLSPVASCTDMRMHRKQVSRLSLRPYGLSSIWPGL